MLSKLIGYEFKATRRIFLPAFGVLLLLSLVNAIFIALPDTLLDRVEMPFGVLMTVYLLARFAVCVLALAYVINRFYKNLLGDEGYLMFTLPVRPSQLIWSKCIAATIWMIVAAVICFVSLLLLALPSLVVQNAIIASDLWKILQLAAGMLLNNNGAYLIVFFELIVVGIVCVANFCMHVYACLSLGSLANRHRLGFAFLAYLLFGIAQEIALLLASWLFSLIGWNIPISLSLDAVTALQLALLLWLAYTAVCLAVNFLITNYILSRHLNLQ